MQLCFWSAAAMTHTRGVQKMTVDLWFSSPRLIWLLTDVMFFPEVEHHKSSKEAKSVTKTKQKQFWHCCVIARHPISLPSSFLCLTDRSEVALNAGCLFIIRQHNEILPFGTWRGIRPRGTRRGKHALNGSTIVYVCLSVWAYMTAAHIPEALDLSADRPDSSLRSLWIKYEESCGKVSAGQALVRRCLGC